jgi:hypothetical protein
MRLDHVCYFLLLLYLFIIGTYKSQKSDSLCEQCPDGYYADTTGSLQCTKCPDGHYCPVSYCYILC